MKLLHIASSEDGRYLDKFSKLAALRGHYVAVARNANLPTTADVAFLARSVQADAIICTNQDVLKLVLEGQYDYIPPNTRRGVTLDDYQGSLLTVHAVQGFTKDLEFLVLNPPEQLYTVPYAEFVFNRFLTKLTNPQDWLDPIPFQWKLFDPAQEDCNEFVDFLNDCSLIAIDIETAVGNPDRTINCVGYAGLCADGTIRIGVVPFNSWAGVCLVRALNDNPVPKIFQNGLYDNTYFVRWGCPVRNWLWDTQHLFHSWLSELPKRLDFISAFSVRRIRYWKDDGSTGNLNDYYRYNALDCWATLSAFLGIMKDIPDWGIRNYVDHEFPLVFPSLHCAIEGFKVEAETFQRAKAETEAELSKDLERLRFLIDSPTFNPNSPQQVAALFKVLGLLLPSTDKASMLKAKASSAFNELILDLVTDYRENAKLNSNYYNWEKIWLERLYYSINPAGTDSARLASKESAFWCGYQIQNVKRGGAVKQYLVADSGWLLCEIDKRQSEARCVAYLSGEKKLINLVESSKDYHSFNASEFFGIPYEKIYDDEKHKTIDTIIRDLAKRTNHGANYNMQADMMLATMGPKNVLRAKTALRLPISMRLRDVCDFLLKRYEKTYPNIKGRWYESIVKRITLSGMLVSALGWTRRFFGKPAQNRQHLNSAVAHEPQNLSVGIVNREFFNIWKASIYGELRNRYRLKAQIHDSILGQYRGEEVPALIAEKYMNTRVQVRGSDDVVREMFIPSDVSAGKTRWSELK